jgi:glycerol uptake facilitator-like aquaporin
MLRRALVAEGLGSLLLAATVIGSGIMAERLAGGNPAVALLANTAATVAALATLIALFGPISGAHFNPAVSIIEALRGRLSLPKAIGYILVQIAGCCLGALLAHAMFEMPLIQASMHWRTGPAQWLSEGVATAGLILVVLGCSNPQEAAWRVAAWIGAAFRLSLRPRSVARCWASCSPRYSPSGNRRRLRSCDGDVRLGHVTSPMINGAGWALGKGLKVDAIKAAPIPRPQAPT